MSRTVDGAENTGVLRSKRNATRYQILVEVAERQPAVSQQEIASAIDVTPQAVSDYLRGLAEEGYVRKHGRGRYEVTKVGVDWLISQTDALRELVEHVSTAVIGEVEIETAIATTAISEGDTVSLSMREGVLHATAGESGSATAVSVTDARAGSDVGVTGFSGVVDYDVGSVTVLSIPGVEAGGSDAVSRTGVAELAGAHDLVAAAGTAAFVTARECEVGPDVRFGTVSAVSEAAMKGLDVLVLAVTEELSAHTDRLRENGITYEVVDAGEE